MKKLIKGIFKLITFVAVVLWLMSAMALDSETMMPTVLCFASSAWLLFALYVVKPE